MGFLDLGWPPEPRRTNAPKPLPGPGAPTHPPAQPPALPAAEDGLGDHELGDTSLPAAGGELGRPG